MINKLIEYSNENGYWKTFKKIINFFIVLIKNIISFLFNKFSTNNLIHKRRIKISADLSKKMNNIVKYGPFKGFILGDGYKWGKADIGNMLLGLYEQEVLQSLQQNSNNRNTLIDLGAADGYFAIGCLVSKIFDKVYAFEISEESKKNLSYNADLNKVSEQLEIFGKATTKFPLSLLEKGINYSQSVILCDIEGGEFELFDDEVFNSLKDAVIIIEIHDWHKDGFNRYKRLQERADKYFNITKLTTKCRDLSIFPELFHLSDNDRWLVCSEGRHYLTTWLRLDPK